MIRIGIICPSEIAFRRFLPALQKANNKVEFTAIGIASPQEWFGDLSKVPVEQIEEQQSRECAKAQTFIDQYGGKIVFDAKQDVLDFTDLLEACSCMEANARHELVEYLQADFLKKSN